ncbi:hypothetical protein Cgig2_014186 [Carnegiea gigantea]|uniref:Uncharacterized protein n=1 Tax=Carnegiea gigantea TaxID=171969 RepID=A0A9Q1JYR8_9CARY|nr:hypothetical protein Cgig2_014186 [Carnegiea gigantea]
MEAVEIPIMGRPVLKRPKAFETLTKFKNKNNYYEYHEDSGHTGQLNWFFRQGKGDNQNHYNLKEKKHNDGDPNIEVISTIITRISDKDLNVRTNHDIWSGGHACLETSHNDALEIQLRIATTMVRWILVDMRNSIDIITLDSLKKLQYDEKHLEFSPEYPYEDQGQPYVKETKFKNKNKYYEYYNDFGAHHFFSAMSIKRPPQVS